MDLGAPRGHNQVDVPGLLNWDQEIVGLAATIPPIAQTESYSALAQAALWLALILALAGVAFWLMKKLRGSSAEDTPETNDLLTKFRELHARGGLSDEEYRTIRTKLATELREELRENGDGI